MKIFSSDAVRNKLLALALLVTLAAGCASSPEPTSTPGKTVEPQITPAATGVVTPVATQTANSPTRLVLWLPPQFDPSAGGQAGAILAARLDEFEAQNPGVQVEVRLKAPSGSGGLLDALSATRAAAPLAAPAVVALSRSDMESAALKGLILPLDDLQGVVEDADWYPYARQLSAIDGAVFGLPFGGDMLLLIYRPAQVVDLLKSIGAADAVLSWKVLAGQSHPVIFPAASPQALISLALYQSLNGATVDANGRPTLDATLLTQVYETFAQGALNGAFPPWITTLENDAQAWQVFRDGRGDILVTWSSSYLQNLPADAVAVPFNGMQTTPYTLSDGWVWVMSDPFPERRELSKKLIVFLSQSDFLSVWSEAAGVLPTRPSALAAWKNQSLAAMLNQVALSAQARPDGVVLTGLSLVLHDTGLEVLKQKSSALDAANQAAERLAAPNE